MAVPEFITDQTNDLMTSILHNEKSCLDSTLIAVRDTVTQIYAQKWSKFHSLELIWLSASEGQHQSERQHKTIP